MVIVERIYYRNFDAPTQLAYWDVDGNHYVAGIGYGTEIICGCCGAVIDIDEVYEFAPAEITNPIIPYEEWMDFTSEIIGSDTTQILLDEEN